MGCKVGRPKSISPKVGSGRPVCHEGPCSEGTDVTIANFEGTLLLLERLCRLIALSNASESLDRRLQNRACGKIVAPIQAYLLVSRSSHVKIVSGNTEQAWRLSRDLFF